MKAPKLQTQLSERENENCDITLSVMFGVPTEPAYRMRHEKYHEIKRKIPMSGKKSRGRRRGGMISKRKKLFNFPPDRPWPKPYRFSLSSLALSMEEGSEDGKKEMPALKTSSSSVRRSGPTTPMCLLATSSDWIVKLDMEKMREESV